MPIALVSMFILHKNLKGLADHWRGVETSYDVALKFRILRYSQVFSDTLRYSQVLSGDLRYSKVLSGTLKYSQVFSGTLRYS